jgi:hypothetical protein
LTVFYPQAGGKQIPFGNGKQRRLAESKGQKRIPFGMEKQRRSKGKKQIPFGNGKNKEMDLGFRG